MRRRDLFAFVAGAPALRPLTVRAQQKAMPVIGFLASGSQGSFALYLAAFREGLNETNYVEGQSVAIEYRWAEGQYDRLPSLATDLVSQKVDLIVQVVGSLRRWRRKARPRRSRSSSVAVTIRSHTALLPVSIDRAAT
jgi:putative tryptophan/tyrosine transport system substrate-binding protein